MAEIIGEIIISVLGFIAYGTGELILYAVTLGRHKPKLPDQKWGFRRELAVSLSTSVGIIFWAAVLVLIAWLVARIHP